MSHRVPPAVVCSSSSTSATPGPRCSGSGWHQREWRWTSAGPMPVTSSPGRADNRGLMVLGGSMGACDDREVPWLAQVRTMLAEATSSRRARARHLPGRPDAGGSLRWEGGTEPVWRRARARQDRPQRREPPRSALRRHEVAGRGRAVARRRDHRAAQGRGAAWVRARPAPCRRSGSAIAPGECSFTPRRVERSCRRGPMRRLRCRRNGFGR